jgi:hypothetical protein
MRGCFRRSDAEVSQLNDAVLGQQDVSRFDVAVDYASIVCGPRSLRHLSHDLDNAIGSEGACDIDQAPAADVFHNKVGTAVCSSVVKNLRHVRVRDRRDRLSFVEEPYQELGVIAELGDQELDGNGSIEASIVGAPDFRHPTSS